MALFNICLIKVLDHLGLPVFHDTVFNRLGLYEGADPLFFLPFLKLLLLVHRLFTFKLLLPSGHGSVHELFMSCPLPEDVNHLIVLLREQRRLDVVLLGQLLLSLQLLLNFDLAVHH